MSLISGNVGMLGRPQRNFNSRQFWELGAVESLGCQHAKAGLGGLPLLPLPTKQSLNPKASV